MKGKQMKAPLHVPSAVNVSKKSATNSIKKAKGKIIEDSVGNGPGLSKHYETVDSIPKKTIQGKVVLPAPSISAATADGARKSQYKSISSARAHGANPLCSQTLPLLLLLGTCTYALTAPTLALKFLLMLKPLLSQYVLSAALALAPVSTGHQLVSLLST
ncbi:hypothetical protein JB92DRAFT_3108437 [Gautieria morchelliformis]|nr:hypothetical protein JB92DRAFT_3108437 [Gautieria morchelliformis]